MPKRIFHLRYSVISRYAFKFTTIADGEKDVSYNVESLFTNIHIKDTLEYIISKYIIEHTYIIEYTKYIIEHAES